MKNSYRSMRGKSIDLQKLMAQQDKNISVGNTKSNARGDQLGRGGRVVKSADEIANEHYNKNNPKAVVQASIKIDEPEQNAKVQKKVAEKPQEDDWVEPVTTPEVKSEPVKEETEEEDPWVETKDGDFVRQSELQGDNNERVSKPKTSRKQSTNKSAQRKDS